MFSVCIGSPILPARRSNCRRSLGIESISGVVLDPSGSPIGDAQIQVRAEEIGFRRQVKSSAAGLFNIPVLPSGRYALAVERTGFSKLEQKDLEVTVGGSVTQS